MKIELIFSEEFVEVDFNELEVSAFFGIIHCCNGTVKTK